MEILLAANETEILQCANLMHRMAPWNKLGFDEAGCKAAFAGHGKEIYLVKDNNNIAGFAILQTSGAFSGYIQSLGIAPEYQGRQLGSELISFCEDRIFNEMPNVFLCVSSFNDAAQRFYYRHGYEKVGELKDHLVRGHDEYLLRKSMGPKSEFRARL